jgi:hypothetical protein
MVGRNFYIHFISESGRAGGVAQVVENLPSKHETEFQLKYRQKKKKSFMRGTSVRALLKVIVN